MVSFLVAFLLQWVVVFFNDFLKQISFFNLLFGIILVRAVTGLLETWTFSTWYSKPNPRNFQNPTRNSDSFSIRNRPNLLFSQPVWHSWFLWLAYSKYFFEYFVLKNLFWFYFYFCLINLIFWKFSINSFNYLYNALVSALFPQKQTSNFFVHQKFQALE